MQTPIIPEVPLGLTPAAQRERERFMRDYAINIKSPQSVALSILVWGPAPTSTSPAAKKRKEICDALIREGHNAMFSEDMPDLTGLKISEKTKEFAQAFAAHLIVILVEDAPGALAEAHDFCNHPDIAGKVFVLIPVTYREGYSAKGALMDLQDGYGGVCWYTEAELLECNVLAKAVRRAEARRNIYHRHGAQH